MTHREFYDWQTMGGGADVTKLVGALEDRGIPWCMIGGLAVNHWSEEPMATADVDLVIAAERIEDAVEVLTGEGFREERFEWSVNLKGESKVSIQISTEAFYQEFPTRSVPADVHGILMRVASLEDTLQGKLAAYQDAGRRPSKRQKDLADIARLIEAHPQLSDQLPETVSSKLEH
ncbi:nucleotidyl transferase AbiEii/AbiGii toxin family protein [Haloferula sp. A504]|uniref:nucleotidyl transferase AbiEii/AbiGii toxin family protein n=1 Tax=Haloferula sp. A504 TaxID=3373601 RepID=UPI0031C2D1AB|nr:nucleotidyl transferase AbiEii/AbiGii toxin family protein [Verrucomicrobiaceae bacterium E54]